MRLLGAVLLLAALTGCTGDDEAPSSEPTPSATTSTSAPPPTATPVPVPGDRDCYALDYQEAVAPTTENSPVDCHGEHTSMTFAVGKLDTMVDGHLLAVDSARVQAQVAAACPARLAPFVGGSLEDRRLSMLRAVWFTPTVEQSDAGASWYRCDAIALARDEKLAPLTGKLAGVLDQPEGRDRYGMCGTAEPGTKGFARVICSADHSWRAIATVPFPDGAYPGVDKVREAGQQPCEDAGRAVASDTLSFQWGYEWPTAAQWRAGQHYGLCWAPD
jgi:Septum formation